MITYAKRNPLIGRERANLSDVLNYDYGGDEQNSGWRLERFEVVGINVRRF